MVSFEIKFYKHVSKKYHKKLRVKNCDIQKKNTIAISTSKTIPNNTQRFTTFTSRGFKLLPKTIRLFVISNNYNKKKKQHFFRTPK